MSDSKSPTLGDVVAAWQKHKEKLQTWISDLEEENVRAQQVVNEDQQLPDAQAQAILKMLYYNNGYIAALKDVLSEGSSAEESSFGVLLQRLMDELPQQAKTLNQILAQRQNALQNLPAFSREEAIMSEKFLEQKWVVLEALIEPSSLRKDEKKELREE